MNFSKLNFIVPIQSNDVVLKIRNIQGIVVHIIKEVECTISQNGINLNIKAGNESALITLDFGSDQEARDAHVLLRQALSTIQSNQNPPIPTSGRVQQSTDFKNESPSHDTTMDGEIVQGISPLLELPSGSVVALVFINGMMASVGDGCSSTDFSSPTFDCIFVRNETTFTNPTSTTVQITSSSFDYIVGDSVIFKDSAVLKCTEITNVTGTTITLQTGVTGTLESIYKPKNYGSFEIGDQIAWFGSSAGYELETTDLIQFSYVVQNLN